MFDAFHAAGLEPHDYDGWIEMEGGRAPRLTPDGVRAITQRLRNAGEALRARTVNDIVVAVDEAVARMVDDADRRTRAVELIARFSRCSIPMAAHVLDRMAAEWRAPALRQLLDSEFRDPQMLDAFRPVGTTGRLLHARGARAALHIFAGNVPGVAVTSIIRSLLVKCPVLGKTAATEPVTAVLFASALHAVDPALGQAVTVTYWPGGSRDIEGAAFHGVEQVVHYGSADAIAELRSRLPAHLTHVTHGHRISFGMVGRDAIPDHTEASLLAQDVAYATAVFDQHGCVSPHTVFVEEGAFSPGELAALIDRALHTIGQQLPAGPLAPSDAAAIRNTRTVAEFRAINGEKVSVMGPDRLDHTVIFDPVPALSASCLNRTLKMCPVHHLEDVPQLVAPYRDVLQSVGLAGGAGRIPSLAQGLASAGVSRISSFRDLPWPSAAWHHDGRGPLLELVYWTETAL